MRRTLRFDLIRLVLGLVIAGLLYADPVDDIVKAVMAEQHIPGVALAVVKDGHIIRSAGYGLANVEPNVPVTPHSVFKVGSVSKQFLASGMMLLVQDGKVRLDDPVRKYFEDAPAAWDGIQIRNLLSHTSGLPTEGLAFDPLKEQADILVIRSSFQGALLFAPGEKWHYSNLAYFTAAEILARVSAEPWPDFLNSRIFRPFRMDSTRTTSPTDLIANRSDGYEWADGKTMRAREYLALRPSGAFVSTVEDLAKWDAALYTDEPLTKTTREQMWTPITLNNGHSSGYGLGWEVRTRAGNRVVYHGGALPGFRAFFARFPEARVSVIVLANSSQSKPADIGWKVASLWLPGVEHDTEPASGPYRQ
jgi:CubicO group peptidase (beta-lactamase class C family)